ncbi:phosphatase PAP2 family protein, partial [Microvirga sp. 3-52]|nr:phosphatase PAP2 family protein [Microvirga sp. 3-52]
CTPRFPTYPSGHATVSGCAATVLSYFFPREERNLQRIANDNASSRLYAGVHFHIDNEEGLNLGRYIGNIIVNHLKTQENYDSDPIDRPYSKYKNADLYPVNYEQFIPFDFNDSCSSLLLDADEPSINKNKKTATSKPK